MEQNKGILLSALSVGVGVGVGIGLASGKVSRWAGYNSSAADADGISEEQIEKELMRLVVHGKQTNITFDDFPYYLSEQTRVLLTSSACVHLKHLDVSKHTRNLSPASRAILLSGPAEFYQQMLAKALAHHFEAKLLLLDVTDFSIKMQSKYGSTKSDQSFKKSISEVTLAQMSSLLGSISILSSREEARGTLCRESSGLDIKSRGMEGANIYSQKHRRIASTSSDMSSISSPSSSNPAPLKRKRMSMSSWSLDEKLLLQSLFKVLV